jgi:hypothetical protein
MIKLLEKFTSDEHIILYMLNSISVDDWNLRREQIKIMSARDELWIARHIDATGLIKKSRIYKKF